jgi:hypothetical protein
MSDKTAVDYESFAEYFRTETGREISPEEFQQRVAGYEEQLRADEFESLYDPWAWSPPKGRSDGRPWYRRIDRWDVGFFGTLFAAMGLALVGAVSILRWALG